VPWITEDGYLDLTRVPLDGILKQAVSPDLHEAAKAWYTLRSIHERGRVEAGVFLLGLLVNTLDDWERRTRIVEALRGFATAGCAAVLFGELRRVKSSNTTRRYLDTVLKTLASMPRELVEEGFEELLQQPGFSPRMRAKFRAVLAELCGVHDWL
jgi:hypothetical protein